MFSRPANFVQGPFICYDPSPNAQFPETVEACHFDGHFHTRRRPVMDVVLPLKARRVCGGTCEPNTNPHLMTYDGVMRHLDDMNLVAPDRAWTASIYITSEPNIADTRRLFREKKIAHVKDYPPHGSTHTMESASEVELLDRNSPAGMFMCMCEDEGIPVKRHAEIVKQDDQILDPYKREATFLREFELRFMETYPKMRRILAHISTDEAVRHMEEYGDPDNYVAEIPPVHACCDRRILVDGGAIITNHHCLPPIKELMHLLSLQRMLCKRPPWLMGFTDAAGHLASGKFDFLGLGGLFVYHCDLELYVETLAGLGILDYLHALLYGNPKRFFGDIVPDNPTPVTLVRKEWTVDEYVPVPALKDWMIPFGYHPDPHKRRRFMYQLAA